MSLQQCSSKYIQQFSAFWCIAHMSVYKIVRIKIFTIKSTCVDVGASVFHHLMLMTLCKWVKGP